MKIIFQIPGDPQTEKTFDDFNRDSDRAGWVGRGFTGELPSDGKWAGGNADNDGDHDPIETLYKHQDDGKIVGPESPFDKGNCCE